MADHAENIYYGDDNGSDNIKKIYPRMTMEEYLNLDESVRGELIGGRFYAMSSPTVMHQRISGATFTALRNFIYSRNGRCEAFNAPLDVKLYEDEDTMVQPDVFVVCDPDKVGDKHIDGAPDLVIEIVFPTNPGHDYIRKLDLYMKAGVREYWIVDPEEKRIVVYIPGVGDDRDITMHIYSFKDDVPVFIYDGQLKINLSEFAE